MIAMDTEVWRTVPEHDHYEVSNYGRVRSWRGWRGRQLAEPRLLAQIKTRLGYHWVGLTKHDGGRQRAWFVHALVLMAFVGPRPSARHQTCHYDGNRSNNRLDNLRWGTAAENAADKVRHGTHVVPPEALEKRPGYHGDANPSAKLTLEQVREVRRLHAQGVKQIDLARKYGVRREAIANIIQGRTWNETRMASQKKRGGSDARKNVRRDLPEEVHDRPRRVEDRLAESRQSLPDR